jgi:murein DD-endopeptidase MepM/ murein hydrolase activator NlpD
MRRLTVLLAALVLATPPAAEAYVSPATGSPEVSRVLRAFDRPQHNWLPGHRGVDLDLPIGAPVLAAGDGTVAFAGVVAGTPTVSIDHADGIRTTYQPVHTRVTRGDGLREGEVIGTLGHPTDGWPGLHWGARTDRDDYLNPLSLLEAPTIRLKPNPS